MAEKRSNGITGVSGEQGVGKTHGNEKAAAQYVLDNPVTGKIGKKVLIYDINFEKHYKKYPAIPTSKLTHQKQKTIARIVPVNPKTNAHYSTGEKQLQFLHIIRNFEDGLLILEDFTSYALNTRSQDIVAEITRMRHKKADIILSVQAISKITKEMWDNISFYRYHKQTSTIDNDRERIPNFKLFKICDNIVKEQYKKATDAYQSGKITEDRFKELASFHMWIDIKKSKVKGCSPEAYIRGVELYLKRYKDEIIDFCYEHDLDHTNREHFNRALKEVSRGYMTYYIPKK